MNETFYSGYLKCTFFLLFPPFQDFEIPNSTISLSFLVETFLIPEKHDRLIFDGIIEHGYIVPNT